MDNPVTFPYHDHTSGTITARPSECLGDVYIPTDGTPAHPFNPQQDYYQWHPEAAFASDVYESIWAVGPSQPMNEHERVTETPGYAGNGPGTVCGTWSPISEDFSFSQQAPTYGRGGGGYGMDDTWTPVMPPTPQLNPTWHHAQMTPSQPQPALHSLQHRKALGRSHKIVTDPALARKASQSALTETMATPPGKSESEVAGPSKRKRLSSDENEPADGAGPGQVTGKKYRVKNRAAAKRCRDKSRQFEIDLAAKEKQVTEEHMILETSAAVLREEILFLKNQILQHGDCNCEVIQTYISKVASQVSNPSAPNQARTR